MRQPNRPAREWGGPRRAGKRTVRRNKNALRTGGRFRFASATALTFLATDWPLYTEAGTICETGETGEKTVVDALSGPIIDEPAPGV